MSKTRPARHRWNRTGQWHGPKDVRRCQLCLVAAHVDGRGTGWWTGTACGVGGKTILWRYSDKLPGCDPQVELPLEPEEVVEAW